MIFQDYMNVDPFIKTLSFSIRIQVDFILDGSAYFLFGPLSQTKLKWITKEVLDWLADVLSEQNELYLLAHSAQVEGESASFGR